MLIIADYARRKTRSPLSFYKPCDSKVSLPRDEANINVYAASCEVDHIPYQALRIPREEMYIL